MRTGAHFWGGLLEGEELRIENFSGQAMTLVIRVCSLGMKANVVVYVDGRNNIDCPARANNGPTRTPVSLEDNCKENRSDAENLSLIDIILLPIRFIWDMIMNMLGMF